MSSALLEFPCHQMGVLYKEQIEKSLESAATVNTLFKYQASSCSSDVVLPFDGAHSSPFSSFGEMNT